MRKLALVLATAVTLAVTAVAAPSPAHARYYGHHGGAAIFGGLIAGAMIAGIASSAYGYGPGYGYYGGYYPAYPAYPAYYGGYYPAYYGGYYPGYYGGYVRRPYYGYRRVYAPRYVHYYGGPRYYGHRLHRHWRRW